MNLVSPVLGSKTTTKPEVTRRNFMKKAAAGIGAIAFGGNQLLAEDQPSPFAAVKRVDQTGSDLASKLVNNDDRTIFEQLTDLIATTLKPYQLLTHKEDRKSFGDSLQTLQESLKNRPNVSDAKAEKAPMNFTNNINWLSNQTKLLEGLKGKKREYSKTEVFRFLVSGKSGIDMQARNGVLNVVYDASTGTGYDAKYHGREREMLLMGLDEFFNPKLHSDLAAIEANNSKPTLFVKNLIK